MSLFERLTDQYPLLTQQDWRYIAQIGIPAYPDTSLLVDDGERSTLTPRGRQFYQAAFDYHGISASVEMLTYAELLEYAIQVSNAKIDDNRVRLNSLWAQGKVPLQERAWTESYLFNPKAGRAELSYRTAQCKSAGSNVIPLPKKKRPRHR